jgi:hypothetical protein
VHDHGESEGGGGGWKRRAAFPAGWKGSRQKEKSAKLSPLAPVRWLLLAYHLRWELEQCVNPAVGWKGTRGRCEVRPLRAPNSLPVCARAEKTLQQQQNSTHTCLIRCRPMSTPANKGASISSSRTMSHKMSTPLMRVFMPPMRSKSVPEARLEAGASSVLIFMLVPIFLLVTHGPPAFGEGIKQMKNN